MSKAEKDTKNRIRIYAMTHKKFQVPSDPLYVPLQVGKEGKDSLGYLTDATGDNISALNCYYSELTGLYWLWKNISDLDYIGTCHYRRYLMNEHDTIFTKTELLDLLQNYDVITSKCIELDFSYHYGFADNHNIRDLDETGNVIKEIYPEYYEVYHRLVHENRTYFGNICVMAKPLFDQYCEWLFHIFSEVHKRIDIEHYDNYHKRVYGFISEFLLYVFVTYHGLKAYECKVALIGEKVETKEMKQKLTAYFHDRDIMGAKEYFASYLKKRPDVLMEASDVTGDLRVAMQIIATADAEQKKYGNSILDKINDFDTLIHLFKYLNGVIRRMKKDTHAEEDLDFLHKLSFSQEALQISVLTFCKTAEEKERAMINLKTFI